MIMASALTLRMLAMIPMPSYHKQWSREGFKIRGKEEHFCSDSLRIEMAR
jgi:hypothetical protein